MEARFHRQVQADLNKILEKYFSISDELGDDFYEEFMNGVRKAVENPQLFHYDASGLRRCNLYRFPYHFLYDVNSGVRVWVLRHDKQKPSLGMRRFNR